MSSKEQYYEYIKLQWEFIKRYLGREINEQFWADIVEDINLTVKSVADSDQEYVKRCLLAVLDDFERKSKNG